MRALVVAVGLTLVACANFVRTTESTYWPGSHNWEFRSRYPEADRLFNAFDYGHAILYEILLTDPAGAPKRLEDSEYRRITTGLLVNPPRLPLEERAIEPRYARLAPEAVAMFDWAHGLHRTLYDVLADPRLSDPRRDSEIARALAYYRSRPDLAFSTVPKNMSLMQEQEYSLAFRRDYPKFNGLIWAYHWLQIGLYEPLLATSDSVERRRLIGATVNRFRQMLTDPPESFPYVMPMTPSIAPRFACRYPEVGAIFDNLHSMHDVVSDVLANPKVRASERRALILRAAAAYRDDTTAAMSRRGWHRMGEMMGIENQGGPPIGFPSSLARPTVPRGAVMSHDRDGFMVGEEHEGHNEELRKRDRDPCAAIATR